MRNFLLQLRAFLNKDLLLESGSAALFASIIFFSFLLVLIFQFGLHLSRGGAIPLVCPLVWLTTLFGGMLRLNQTFRCEEESKMLETLKLVDGAAIPFFVSKVIVNLILLVVLEATILTAVLVLFNVPLPLHLVSSLWGPLLLGTVGFVVVGTTLSAMLIDHRGGDLLLPVIVYPLLVPVVIGVVQSIDYSAAGIAGIDGNWIRILISFDLIYLIASVMVFDRLMHY